METVTLNIIRDIFNLTRNNDDAESTGIIFIEYSVIASIGDITVYKSQLSESSLGWYSATCFSLSPPFPGSKSELLDPASNPLSKLLNGSSISSPLVTADSWTTSTARSEISFVMAQTNDKMYSNHLYTYRNALSTVLNITLIIGPPKLDNQFAYLYHV